MARDRHRGKIFVAAALGLGLALGAAVPVGQAAEDQDYRIATASTGGTYHPIGVALATLIKVRVQPTSDINLSAVNSAGSGENVKLLRQGDVQFAIIQGLFGAYAKSGAGPLEADGPYEELRSITVLWPNVEHFIIRTDDVSSGTIDDFTALKGKTISLGRPNSGTIGSNRLLLSQLGVNVDADYDLAAMGYGKSAAALQEGDIDAMSTPGGVPVSAVTRAFAAMGAKLAVLDFTDEQLAKANDTFEGLWFRYVVPAGTYPGQAKEIRTIAQPNFLAVRADVPEETIYLITKAIYENLLFLNGIHPATKYMSLERATVGLPVPLHPGAIRYFEEAGIPVPEHLKP